MAPQKTTVEVECKSGKLAAEFIRLEKEDKNGCEIPELELPDEQLQAMRGAECDDGIGEPNNTHGETRRPFIKRKPEANLFRKQMWIRAGNSPFRIC